MTLKGAVCARIIRVFGNDHYLPAAGDPVPLEGTGK